MLDRKLARDLFRSKGLLLAITSIIGVGVMCYVSMQSVYHNLRLAKLRYYRQCRMADFWLDLKKAPVAELAGLDRIAGLAEVHSRIQFPVTVDLPEVERPINALVLSMPDRRRAVINNLVVQQGDYFTDRRSNEIIVNEAFARRHRLYPGQWIHLLMNNRRQEFFIVGTAISSEFAYLLGPGAIMPDPDNYGVFYIKHQFAEEIFDFAGATNQVVGRLAPASQSRSAVILRQMETMLEPFGVREATPLERQPSNYYLTNEIAGLGAYATVVPVIFLTVAAVVLNVLINRLARQQRTIVGTLKALGYSDGQIFAHFLKFGVTVGVAGGVLGSLLGFASSAGMTTVYRLYFEFPDLRNGFYWQTHAIGLLVSVVCSLSGTIHGARTMLKLRPAEAMRPSPPERGRVIWLERWSALWRRLGPAWRMSLRSVFRHRQRTASGLFAACMGAGLLVNGFMMTEALEFLLDFQFHRVQRSDLDLTFHEARGRDALDEVSRLPGVDCAEPVLEVGGALSNGPYQQKGSCTGLLLNPRLTTPRERHGQPIPIPETGLVLTRQLARKLRVQPGDRVLLRPSQGERRPMVLTVSSVADSYLGLSAYAEIGYLSRQLGEELAITGAQLATDGNPEHQRQLYRRLTQTPGVRSVTSREDVTRNLTDTLLKNQYVMILVLVGFAGVIFFGSILNASVVSLTERQREVATFRAMGYTPWEVGAVFLRENLLVNLAGTLLGLPVGYGLMWITAAAYNNDLIRIPVTCPPWIGGVTFLLSLSFALLAHGVVQWMIYRLDFLEALKVKE